MSEELIFVFGIILTVGILGYLFMGGASKLSATAIKQYLASAGFSGDDLNTAVAIALAESGGDPNAVGDNGTSYGLFQVHWTVHPEYDKSRLFDPAYNSYAAFDLYLKRGRGFQDWSTFTVAKSDGSFPYEAYLQQAVSA